MTAVRRLLAVAAGLAILTACDGGASPDPVPSPSPTRQPTASEGTTVPTCPPPAGFAETTVTVPLRDAARLPDGGRVLLAEVTPAANEAAASVVLEVSRTTPGCPELTRLDLPEAGGATVAGLKIDVISVNPSRGGKPPSAQLRISPA